MTAAPLFSQENAQNSYQIFQGGDEMGAGRPRKAVTVSTRKISKEDREKREKQEAQLKLEREELLPPSFLGEVAAQEFSRVIEEVEKIDLLDNLDLTTLAVYANAWEQYVNCAEHIRDNGVTSQRVNAQGSYEVISPYVTAQANYAKQIMQCSTKLGLATTDRLKLIVPTEAETTENRFLKYVK